MKEHWKTIPDFPKQKKMVSDLDIRYIKYLFYKKHLTKVEIRATMKISRCCLDHIISGRRWSHIN